jgi:hypothetical protein
MLWSARIPPCAGVPAGSRGLGHARRRPVCQDVAGGEGTFDTSGYRGCRWWQIFHSECISCGAIWEGKILDSFWRPARGPTRTTGRRAYAFRTAPSLNNKAVTCPGPWLRYSYVLDRLPVWYGRRATTRLRILAVSTAGLSGLVGAREFKREAGVQRHAGALSWAGFLGRSCRYYYYFD